MHDLYKLKEMLCEELEEYGRKGEMTANTLEIVDKLAHTVKNLDKIIKMHEDEEYEHDYSSRGRSMRGRKYDDGMRRESGRRYSRSPESMIDRLEDMMDDAPDDKTRMEIQRLMDKMR